MPLPPSPTAILVVDDDRDLREILADCLQDEGYDVATACDGRDALEQLAYRAFAVVVTDTPCRCWTAGRGASPSTAPATRPR
jgi:CheY-like chemotaxis protein